MTEHTVIFLRAQALSHPLAVLALVGLAIRLHQLTSGAAAPPRTLQRSSNILLVTAIALYSLSIAVYAFSPIYIDHVEPSIASVSWAVMQGQPAYPDPASANVYGLPYGPLLFLANGVTMAALGPTIATSKATAFASSLLSLALLGVASYRAYKQSWTTAVSLAIAGYFMFGAGSFWVRAEPLLLLCASAGVLSLTLPALPASILAGVAMGIGINVKISALIYLWPIWTVLWRAHGTRAALQSLAAGGAVIAMPFIFVSGLSATGYWSWLDSATAHGLRLRSLPRSLEWAAMTAGAIHFSASPTGSTHATRQMTLLRWCLIAAIGCSVPLAMKHGTGVYHFLPFVPLVAFAAAPTGGGTSRGAFVTRAVTMAWIVLGTLQATIWVDALRSLPASAISAEVRSIAAERDGTIAMGYAEPYRLSFFRPLFVFAGQPYSLDGASLMDWHWSGRTFPEAAVTALRRCDVDEWVFPSGSPPFVLRNAYAASGNVLDIAFVEAFHDSYGLRKRGTWFDVWRCKDKAALHKF